MILCIWDLLVFIHRSKFECMVFRGISFENKKCETKEQTFYNVEMEF